MLATVTGPARAWIQARVCARMARSRLDRRQRTLVDAQAGGSSEALHHDHVLRHLVSRQRSPHQAMSSAAESGTGPAMVT
jgi:hypothetical protein